MSEAQESEYKGSPVLILSQGPEDRFPFSFGIRKARLILDHYDDIASFVGRHDVKQETESGQ